MMTASGLEERGIMQETKRHFGSLVTFGISSSICSVIVGIIPLYGQSIKSGGPGVMIWGFIIVGLFALTHACCLAEMASTYPTAGTLFDWSFLVGGPEWGPFLSWMTAWLNMLGQVASIGAAIYAASLEVVSLATLLGPVDVLSNQPVIFGVFTSLLLFAGVSNIFTEQVLTRVSVLGVVTHLFGCIFIMVFVLAFAPSLQSGSFVFTDYENMTGIDSTFSVYLIGTLSAATTYTGYDAAASIAEETVHSQNSPRAIVLAVATTILLGSALIITLNFSIQDVSALVSADDGANVFNMLVLQTVGSSSAVAFHFVLFLAMQCAACANMTSVSRLIYSFSREGALPFSSFWGTMNTDYNSPIRAVILATLLTWLLGVVGWQGDIFPVFFSLSTVAYYASYFLPVISRVTIGWYKNYECGEFTLGCLSRPMCIVSSCFCCFIVVVLCLPLTANNVNYAGPGLLAAILYAIISWVVYARYWYKRDFKLGLPVLMDSMVTEMDDQPSFDGWHNDFPGRIPASLAELHDAPAAEST